MLLRVGLIVAAGVLTTLVLSSATASTTTPRGITLPSDRQPPRLPATEPRYPPRPPQAPIGLQAVTPTRPGQPRSYGATDVSAFLRIHRLPGLASATPTQVSYISVADASRNLRGADLGLPPTQMVYFVWMSGRVTARRPPKSPGAPDQVIVFTKGFAIFDAQTGNLLITGGIT